MERREREIFRSKKVLRIMLTLLMWGLLTSSLGLAIVGVDRNASVEPAAIASGSELASSSSSSPLSIRWNKTYGGSEYDVVKSVRQTGDGGFAFIGSTGSFGAGGSDFWLVKVDVNGTQQWMRTFGGSDADQAYDLELTSDGGYVIVGTTKSFGAGGWDAWLIKADSFGMQEWNMTYGGTSHEEANSVVQTQDGGFALAGYTLSYGAGGRDFWLVKTDEVGNVEWNKTFGGNDWDQANALEQTGDGDFALFGVTWSFGAGSADFWLVKADSLGIMEWSHTYGGADSDLGHSFRQTKDGGYILAGHVAGTSHYGWLVKTDLNGNMQWNQKYGREYGDTLYSVQQTTDGRYIAAGHTFSYGVVGADFWLIRTDSSGNVLWNQTYGRSTYDYGRILELTSDGGYMVAGDTWSAGDYNAWLIRFVPPPPPPDWWPMFQHDPRHEGFSTSEAPDTNNVLWAYTMPSYESVTWSSPAVVNGTLYIGQDKFYALDAQTGALKWSLDGYTAYNFGQSSPAVAYGKVFIGGAFSLYVYAFNATTGALNWTYRTDRGVKSSPTVAEGKVFIGADDGRVYALNATTGTLIWYYDFGWLNDVRTSPAVAEGVVFVSGARQATGNRIVALNATNGGMLWSYPIESIMQDSSPTVADGKVFVGTQASTDHNVYALNATTGTLIWNYTAYVYSTPAVAYGTVYVGVYDDGHKIIALNATTGSLMWSYNTGGSIRASPVVADGKVFHANYLNRLYALNASTGATIWTYPIGSWASPAVADGKVYFFYHNSLIPYDNRLYAFYQPKVHDIAITDVTLAQTLVGQGYPLAINVTVENQGEFTETFNLTAYYDSTSIGTQTVSNLILGDQATSTFTWNTTGIASGNYTISAYATPLPGEVDTADNTYIDGTVEVAVISIDVKNLKLTDQNGNPKTDFSRGDVVQFNFTIQNLGKPPLQEGLVSVMVLDATNTSMFLSYTFEDLNPGASKELLIGYRIPLDGSVGTCTAKITVFTDWPSKGGIGLDIETSTFEVMQ